MALAATKSFATKKVLTLKLPTRRECYSYIQPAPVRAFRFRHTLHS